MEVLVPCLLAQGRGQQDAFSRKEAIKCFTLIANGIEKKEQLAAHKDEIPVAQSLGKLTLNVVQKVEHEDDRLDQTRQILRAFHQNM